MNRVFFTLYSPVLHQHFIDGSTVPDPMDATRYATADLAKQTLSDLKGGLIYQRFDKGYYQDLIMVQHIITVESLEQ
jgi:hypothetical protein